MPRAWERPERTTRVPKVPRLPSPPEPPAKPLGLRPGVVAQEAEDRGPEANVGRDTALLPIEEGAGVAAQGAGGILLQEPAVQAGTLEVLAHGLGV